MVKSSKKQQLRVLEEDQVEIIESIITVDTLGVNATHDQRVWNDCKREILNTIKNYSKRSRGVL